MVDGSSSNGLELFRVSRSLTDETAFLMIDTNAKKERSWSFSSVFNKNYD